MRTSVIFTSFMVLFNGGGVLAKKPSKSSSSSVTKPSEDVSMDSMMENIMKQAGVDPTQMEEMMKKMGGKMPSMEESMSAMQEMMNSPIFAEYLNDPEKLEESRQMILNNPMMKGMMASIPGFDEILNDPIKWRETMLAAASMYKNMGSDLSKMMGGSLGDIGNFGLENTALDELSEGED